MRVETLKMKFPFAREKLQPLFYDDKRADVTIICNGTKFHLQKAFLRLESGYFKRLCLPNTTQLIINESFKPKFFTDVMSCFYGGSFQCNRTNAIEYFDIINFLEVDTLLKQLREDMITNISHYDIFILMQMAHKHNEEGIFTASLKHIQSDNFESLRYAKLELLKCSEELFKLVIQTHNRSKATKDKGLQFREISDLILEFCVQKKYSIERHNQLKFELIDKTCLTAQEHKEIFLDPRKNFQSIELQSIKPLNMTQSLEIKGKKEIDLEILNTYQKKRNEELSKQNQVLMNSITELANSSAENQRKHEKLLSVIEQMRANLKQKEQQDKKQKEVVAKLEKTIQQIQKDLKEKGELIIKLERKVAALEQKKKTIPYNDESVSSRGNETVQSHIVPASFFTQAAEKLQPVSIAKKDQPQSKQKREQSQDEQEIQAKYIDRLFFDKEPVCAPKKFLPRLVFFWDQKGFYKKELNLLLRFTKLQSLGKPESLFNRDGLLVLLKTKNEEIIGGYTGARLQKNTKAYVEDPTAFIFSLTKNEKFSIKESAMGQAIYVSEKYLICFAHDLMISKEMLKEQSTCAWPTSYHEVSKEKRDSKWLTGQGENFSISEIEVYEVKSGEMKMEI